KPDAVRYRPVYVALLTRKGLARQFRDEALSALTKMDNISAARVLFDALAKVPADDDLTADALVGLLLAQPADSLKQARDTFAKAIDGPSGPIVLRGAYGGLLMADGSPTQAWQTATAHEGHLQPLLRSVHSLPPGASTDALRTQL